MMASIETPTQLKIEHLLQRVKQLSPVELDEFTRQLTEWQQQREAAISEGVDPDATDAEVVAFIRKNSQLPEKAYRRYWQLRRKREGETLSDDEQQAYEELIRKSEIMNVKRLEALAILVQRWGKPVKEIMGELGLFVCHFDGPEFSDESVQKGHSERPQ
ncbi:hypothetical protein F4009_12900 [Candidatus Poribacteria bacterium]|nr:hypothetical protein [Candidatus Poribacteria bacterium]MYH82143.1 hypothetical protein [Candidatus Poribacteria bacterium]MYK94872.1 hypothetical protein [Candidatus Poribacteria bacterium]